MTDHPTAGARHDVLSWPLAARETSTRSALCVPVALRLVARVSSILDRFVAYSDGPARTPLLPCALLQTSPLWLPFGHRDQVPGDSPGYPSFHLFPVRPRPEPRRSTRQALPPSLQSLYSLLFLLPEGMRAGINRWAECSRCNGRRTDRLTIFTFLCIRCAAAAEKHSRLTPLPQFSPVLWERRQPRICEPRILLVPVPRVFGILGDHLPHAPLGPRGITGVAGNQMNVDMEDTLPRRHVHVHAHVVAVGTEIVSQR